MSTSEPITILAPEGGESISSQLALIADMSRDFAVSLDLEATLRHALNRIADLVGAEGGALFLLEEETDTLLCHASVGPTDITGLSLRRDQGIVGRSVESGAPEIVRDVAKDPHFAKTVDAQTGFTTRSILCAPMSVKEQKIGAIELVNKRSGDGLFSEADLHMLQVLATSAALAILNARMAEALVEQERVRRELQLAAEIQRNLLPEPEGEDFPIHGRNVPARKVSGDFFDFFTLPDGRVYFTLGDASGKGINAALLVSKAASVFRCLGRTVHDPGRLLKLVNDEISETATRGMFVTMVGGLYDPHTGKVRLANAGHEPPLHFAKDGTITAFQADAPPIGISPLLVGDHDFPEIEIDLDGGTLFIFTDGVTEGYLEDGSLMEVEGLRTMLEGSQGNPLTERLKAVTDRLARPGVELHDDITILAVTDSHRPPLSGADETDPVPEKAGAGERLIKVAFPSKPDRLKLGRSIVRTVAQTSGCSRDTTHDLVLAVDEACQNIIRHAYKGSPDGMMELEIDRDGDSLVILIRDYAEPIDPSKVKPRDLDDVRPGGLGTHFIKEAMDEVAFLPTPSGGGNLLKLVKRIA